MLYKLNHILNDINCHLEEKKPFSLVRVGDGDLKLLWDIHLGKVNKQKFERSGIPEDQGQFVIDIYRDGCNTANYTSSFDEYYTEAMWNRKFSKGTRIKIKNWKEVYKNVGITNRNFCSPEIGFFFFLKNVKNNLINQMKGRNVCIITSYKRVDIKLKRIGINAELFSIPGINQGHYSSYNHNVKTLKKLVAKGKFDIFLNAAGALGKGYSYHIKEAGGICIDIGNVARFWCNGAIVGRYKKILIGASANTFQFTKHGKKFERHI